MLLTIVRTLWHLLARLYRDSVAAIEQTGKGGSKLCKFRAEATGCLSGASALMERPAVNQRTSMNPKTKRIYCSCWGISSSDWPGNSDGFPVLMAIHRWNAWSLWEPCAVLGTEAVPDHLTRIKYMKALHAQSQNMLRKLNFIISICWYASCYLLIKFFVDRIFPPELFNHISMILQCFNELSHCFQTNSRNILL